MAIFFITFGATTAYLWFSRRPKDLFFLAIIGFYLYHLPYFFGDYGVKGSEILTSTKVSGKAYLFVNAIGIALLLSLVLFDNRWGSKGSTLGGVRRVWRTHAYVMIGVASSLIMAAVFFMGIDGVRELKGEKNEGVAQLAYNLGIWGVLVALSLALASRQVRLQNVAVALLVAHLFMVGSRSLFVTGMVIILMFYTRQLTGKSSRNFVRFGILGLALLTMTLVYKEVYRDVRAGQWGAVLEKLASTETYVTAFTFGESYIVSSHLEDSLSAESRLGKGFAVHRFLSVIPFASDFYADIVDKKFPRYSNIIGSSYYSQVKWGVASNIWAEAFAISGWIGGGVLLVGWIALVYGSNRVWMSGNMPLYFVYLMPAIFYSLFYLHRVDLTFITGAFKVCFLFYGIGLVIVGLFPRVPKRRRLVQASKGRKRRRTEESS